MLGQWLNTNKGFSSAGFPELHFTFDECKNCMIFAKANIIPRVPFGTTLANDDVAGKNGFAAKFFDAETTTS